tara:strand:+ start:215 stop:532 length:318 start_codon:yes stop_codon:yes gene_type:complete
MVNSLEQWQKQQEAWGQRRLKQAISMPLQEALEMIAYKTAKTIQQAKRQGRDEDRVNWMRLQSAKQVQACCEQAGVPVPPASSYTMTTSAYEKKMARQKGWKTRV